MAGQRYASLFDKDDILAQKQEMRQQIDTLIDTIRSEVLQCDPIELLSYCQYVFLSCNVGYTSECQQLNNDNIAAAHAAEYVQSIYVAAEITEHEEIIHSISYFNSIICDIIQLHRITDYYLMLSLYNADNPNSKETNEAILECQSLFLTRGKRYMVFEEQYYRYLLLDHNEILNDLFGVSASEIVDGITKLQYALTQGRGVYILSKLQQNLHPELDIPDFYVALDKNDVCNITGWPERFVDSLAYGRGEASEFYKHRDYPGWCIINLPIQRRPFIKIGNKYYCFDYYSFVDNFYRAVQKAVSDSCTTYQWKDVQQKASEQMVANIFERLLPGCVIYLNNIYPKHKSLRETCENDILITYYDIAIIVEVKGGAVNYTAPITDSENHIRSYNSLIKIPSDQCSRFYNYLTTNAEAQIFTENNQLKASLDTHGFSDIFMMSITVDNINHIAAKAEKIAFLNLTEPVMCMAVDDLMVYQDYFDSPLEFIHFIKQRRKAISIRQLALYDELDHLGMYIEYNCYWMQEDIFPDGANILCLGYRELLDTYYGQKYTNCDFAVKPCQAKPKMLKDIISFLDASSIHNKIAASCYLLDMSNEAREELCQTFVQCCNRQEALKRQMPILSSFRYLDNLPYTCFIQMPNIHNYSSDEHDDYTMATMLWNNEEKRVLITISYDVNNAIHNVRFCIFQKNMIPEDRRWELYEMGKANANNRLAKYRREHGSKIPRNMLCPCGSGRKYKHCCGG